jgi:lipoprotein-anchoring transpeptidase ErfK/SrfK
VAAVVSRVGYCLRSNFVSRRVLIAAVLVALTALAAAVAVPSRARAGSNDTVRIESVFPAAGSLLVNSVPVRKTPDPTAHVIKVMHDFRPDFRPQEMFAVGSQVGSDGQVWYHISIPMRPNGTYGWIPARTVSLSPTHNQIVVNLRTRTIDLYKFGKHKWHGKVAIGAPGRETPLGHYYVAARFVPYHDTFLGVFAVETSAYSKLTEWPGGGVVGIHGTSLPQLLGKAVSHGCVRVSNQTAAKMKSLAPLGTPIWIKK